VSKTSNCINNHLLEWFKSNLEVFDDPYRTPNDVIRIIDSTISIYEEKISETLIDKEIIEIVDFIFILTYLKELIVKRT